MVSISVELGNQRSGKQRSGKRRSAKIKLLVVGQVVRLKYKRFIRQLEGK